MIYCHPWVKSRTASKTVNFSWQSILDGHEKWRRWGVWLVVSVVYYWTSQSLNLEEICVGVSKSAHRFLFLHSKTIAFASICVSLFDPLCTTNDCQLPPFVMAIRLSIPARAWIMETWCWWIGSLSFCTKCSVISTTKENGACTLVGCESKLCLQQDLAFAPKKKTIPVQNSWEDLGKLLVYRANRAMKFMVRHVAQGTRTNSIGSTSADTFSILPKWYGQRALAMLTSLFGKWSRDIYVVLDSPGNHACDRAVQRVVASGPILGKNMETLMKSVCSFNIADEPSHVVSDVDQGSEVGVTMAALYRLPTCSNCFRQNMEWFFQEQVATLCLRLFQIALKI